MRIRIEGVDLPGSRAGGLGIGGPGSGGLGIGGPGRDGAGGGPGSGADALRFGNVHVGVQRTSDVVELVPADAASATWALDVTSRDIDGLLDVGGPWVHGRPGARFLYLSWGNVDGDSFTMFRRAKLMFGDIPTEALRAAHDGDGQLVGRLGLTDGHGGPRCARVRPPDITWQYLPR